MTRQQMIMCLDYLFKKYPASKVEGDNALDLFYQAFGGYSAEAMGYVIKRYASEGKYFPSVQDLKEIVDKVIFEVEVTLSDPRNEFYAKVSEEAGARRERKLQEARRILHGFRNRTKQLRGSKE